MNSIRKAKIKDKRILVRAGFDVPIKEGKVVDDTRILAALVTIKYLLEKGAKKVILVSHQGRPKGQIVEELRMAPVAERLSKLMGIKNEVHKLPDRYLISDRLELVENIRFEKGEKENDPKLAQKLAKEADIFVQDAFAVCHRAETSIVGISKLLPSYAGFLVEKEIENLRKLFQNPAHPLVIIIGGAKIEEKEPVIAEFYKIADFILVGGITANILLKQGKYKNDSKVVLPVDGVGEPYLDIGPKTIANFKDKIEAAKTIFWNGNLGKSEEEEYATGSTEIAKALAKSQAKIKVIAGGDTVALVSNLGLSDKMTFISTGGGAALEFLSGKKLPGLEVLE